MWIAISSPPIYLASAESIVPRDKYNELSTREVVSMSKEQSRMPRARGIRTVMFGLSKFPLLHWRSIYLKACFQDADVKVKLEWLTWNT